MDWEFGMSKLLYIEWMNNKGLLYSSGNYIQYPIINHSWKHIFLKMEVLLEEVMMNLEKM